MHAGMILWFEMTISCRCICLLSLRCSAIHNCTTAHPVHLTALLESGLGRNEAQKPVERGKSLGLGCLPNRNENGEADCAISVVGKWKVALTVSLFFHLSVKEL